MKSLIISYVILHFYGFMISLSWMKEILEQFPDYTPLVLLSGLAGGFVRVRAAGESWWPDGLGSIISGGLVATFLWPAAHPAAESFLGKFDMEPASAVMFGGFITGLLGLAIPAFILDLFRARSERIKREEEEKK